MDVRAHLFGHPRIEVGTERIDPRLSAQGLLVFALLVTRPGEALTRDEVAFTLWPDEPESEARAMLRRQIYKLQRAFPASREPWIRCTGKTIAWGCPERTWVDVNEFRRLAKEPATAHLAAGLATAELLPFADHEWVVALRETLRRQACAILEELVHRFFAAGDPLATLRSVEALLAHDPWREAAIRVLMATRCRLGDRAGALAAYRRFRERLSDEFGVEPMPETQVLHAAIARGETRCADDEAPLFALASLALA